MNKCHLILLFILLGFIPVYSFGNNILDLDSLRFAMARYDNTAQDSAYTKIQISNHYLYHNLDSASIYVDQVLTGLRKQDYVFPDTFSQHLVMKSLILQAKKEFRAGISYNIQALHKAKSKKNREEFIGLLINLTFILSECKDKEYLDFLNKEVLIADYPKNKESNLHYALISQYQSFRYARLGNYEMALESLLKISARSLTNVHHSYRYILRSSLARYMKVLGKEKNAEKQLHSALKDTLYNHQKKQIYYDLCDINLNLGKISEASRYLQLFSQIENNTYSEQRDYHYLSAEINEADKDYTKAFLEADAAMIYQKLIDNNSKLLELFILKAQLNRLSGKGIALHRSMLSIDSLLRTDKSLDNAVSLTKLYNSNLLNKFLQIDTSLFNEVELYTEKQNEYENSIIQNDLDANILQYENREQEFMINSLIQSKSVQNRLLLLQSRKIKFALALIVGLLIIAGLFCKGYLKRKRIVDALYAEKSALSYKLEASTIEQASEYVTILTKTTSHKIKTEQLMYINAESEGARIHLENRSFYVSVSLKDIMKQLPTTQFVKIFRSIVVNIAFVQSANSKFVILENGKALNLSRTYKNEVRKRLKSLNTSN